MIPTLKVLHYGKKKFYKWIFYLCQQKQFEVVKQVISYEASLTSSMFISIKTNQTVVLNFDFSGKSQLIFFRFCDLNNNRIGYLSNTHKFFYFWQTSIGICMGQIEVSCLKKGHRCNHHVAETIDGPSSGFYLSQVEVTNHYTIIQFDPV